MLLFIFPSRRGVTKNDANMEEIIFWRNNGWCGDAQAATWNSAYEVVKYIVSCDSVSKMLIKKK